MLEPRPVGKPFGGGEFTLALDEHFVDFGERSGSQRRATVGVGLFQRLAVFRGAAGERVHGVLEGRDIQVRRARPAPRPFSWPRPCASGTEYPLLSFLAS